MRTLLSPGSEFDGAALSHWADAAAAREKQRPKLSPLTVAWHGERHRAGTGEPMSIPAFRLVAEPMTDEARAVAGFKWADPEIGRRHRLGGEPTWLQSDETPRCADCGRHMTFYAQLDSVGDDLNLADCGLVYVFVCLDDFDVKAVLQSG